MRKDLARCSKHPGRTQQPYYYGFVPAYSGGAAKSKARKSAGFFVDLPGYGYASASPQAVESWQQNTQEYLISRRDAGSFQRLFLLIDARRGLSRDSSKVALDLSVMKWMDEESIPYTVVITKADCVIPAQVLKVANEACMRYQQQHQREQEYHEYLLENGEENDEVTIDGCMSPVIHITSAKKNEGMRELRSAIETEFYTDNS